MHAVVFDTRLHTWLRFCRPLEVVVTHETDRVTELLAYVHHRVRCHRLFAAGYICYEAAPAFDPVLCTHEKGPMPLLCFGLFARADVIPSPGRTDTSGVRMCPAWTPSIDRDAYTRAITALRAHIARGDTYQVNYTFHLRGHITQEPWHVFTRLCAAQQAPYAAFIETDDWAVCSASPELFFSYAQGLLTARPMKGTCRRGRDSESDERNRHWLQHSVKNRAENVMITDMLRNDIGRIAIPGSVRTPHLFSVERYPTVWQMTSTVTGRTTHAIPQVMGALFPCASITGAPKRRTMEIIAQSETAPRGIYTGTIGYMGPGDTAQFSVAIRTVTIHKPTAEAHYGVGGGIVWDSRVGEEFDECRLKAHVLHASTPHFDLLETMRWHNGCCPRLAYHLDRLCASARYFGYCVSARHVRRCLARYGDTLDPHTDYRIRMRCTATGAIHITSSALPVCGATPGPVRCSLAHEAVDAQNIYLYHKTTNRTHYDRIRHALAPEYEDALMYNREGELTETTIANLVCRIDGVLVTPPAECGLLPGILRRILLERGLVTCRRIPVDALSRCSELYRINAVRGWQRICL